jgi:hypothetical protein
MRPAAFLCVVALYAGGCGHRRMFDLSGTWQGGLSSEHSAYEVMTLRQDGGTISGVICRISSGHRIFHDVPVSGRYPSFTFQYFGDTVTGWAAAEDLIVAYRPGSTAGDLTFIRASASDYERCASAPP